MGWLAYGLLAEEDGGKVKVGGKRVITRDYSQHICVPQAAMAFITGYRWLLLP